MASAAAPSRPEQAFGRFLEPATLTRISSLELLAKTVVEGFISGLHRSPFLGRSMDFAEYRAYMPGDDIRQIDWKLYSRSDRFYVKQFEGDTNTNVLFMLDVSRSMDFGTGAITKLDYGRFLASSLAYLAAKQKDRVGLVTFDDDIVEWVPPAAKHLRVALVTLDRLEPGGSSDLVRPLDKVTSATRRRGIGVLISDLYAEPDAVVRAVKGLSTRGMDLIVFQLLDPAELELPWDQPLDMVDLESGERLPVVPESVSERYQELMEGHLHELGRRLGELRVDYEVVDISKPLDWALYRYLARRLSAMKSR
jgi:uncharacterized protein (DUF58 family)